MLSKSKVFFRVICLTIVCAVFWSGVCPNILQAKQAIAAEMVTLPKIGTMVGLSDSFNKPFLRGVRYDESNPFNLEFILDRGTEGTVSAEEKSRLVRYFLAALTVPEDKLWVNLSPYEKERIIDDSVVSTEIGETLLAQDYLLKQLSASLTHPDTEAGSKYWKASNGVDSSNKVWIKPEQISIFDQNNTIFISDLLLAVEAESEDKNVLIPLLEKEVNQGRNFSQLRQMIYSIILAQWFKRKFSDSLFSFYFNSEKIEGVNLVDPAFKDKVFEQYVEAFEKGAYDTVKKIRDPQTDRLIKRKYFSGGVIASSSVAKVDRVELSDVLTSIGPNNEKEMFSIETGTNQLGKAFIPLKDVMNQDKSSSSVEYFDKLILVIEELQKKGINNVTVEDLLQVVENAVFAARSDGFIGDVTEVDVKSLDTAKEVLELVKSTDFPLSEIPVSNFLRLLSELTERVPYGPYPSLTRRIKKEIAAVKKEIAESSSSLKNKKNNDDDSSGILLLVVYALLMVYLYNQGALDVGNEPINVLNENENKIENKIASSNLLVNTAQRAIRALSAMREQIKERREVAAKKKKMERWKNMTDNERYLASYHNKQKKDPLEKVIPVVIGVVFVGIVVSWIVSAVMIGESGVNVLENHSTYNAKERAAVDFSEDAERSDYNDHIEVLQMAVTGVTKWDVKSIKLSLKYFEMFYAMEYKYDSYKQKAIEVVIRKLMAHKNKEVRDAAQKSYKTIFRNSSSSAVDEVIKTIKSFETSFPEDSDILWISETLLAAYEAGELKPETFDVIGKITAAIGNGYMSKDMNGSDGMDRKLINQLISEVEGLKISSSALSKETQAIVREIENIELSKRIRARVEMVQVDTALAGILAVTAINFTALAMAGFVATVIASIWFLNRINTTEIYTVEADRSSAFKYRLGRMLRIKRNDSETALLTYLDSINKPSDVSKNYVSAKDSISMEHKVWLYNQGYNKGSFQAIFDEVNLGIVRDQSSSAIAPHKVVMLSSIGVLAGLIAGDVTGEILITLPSIVLAIISIIYFVCHYNEIEPSLLKNKPTEINNIFDRVNTVMVRLENMPRQKLQAILTELERNVSDKNIDNREFVYALKNAVEIMLEEDIFNKIVNIKFLEVMCDQLQKIIDLNKNFSENEIQYFYNGISSEINFALSQLVPSSDNQSSSALEKAIKKLRSLEGKTPESLDILAITGLLLDASADDEIKSDIAAVTAQIAAALGNTYMSTESPFLSKEKVNKLVALVEDLKITSSSLTKRIEAAEARRTRAERLVRTLSIGILALMIYLMSDSAETDLLQEENQTTQVLDAGVENDTDDNQSSSSAIGLGVLAITIMSVVLLWRFSVDRKRNKRDTVRDFGANTNEFVFMQEELTQGVDIDELFEKYKKAFLHMNLLHGDIAQSLDGFTEFHSAFVKFLDHQHSDITRGELRNILIAFNRGVKEKLEDMASEVSSAVGGINLDGLLDDVEVVKSNTSIRLSPDMAAAIPGLTFRFIGESKVLPLNQILVAPVA